MPLENPSPDEGGDCAIRFQHLRSGELLTFANLKRPIRRQTPRLSGGVNIFRLRHGLSGCILFVYFFPHPYMGSVSSTSPTHTAGSWKIVETKDFDHEIVSANGREHIALVPRKVVADLIAAAPELLAFAQTVGEMCWASEDQTRGNDDWTITPEERRRLLHQYREVIAKVKGLD